MTAARIRLAAWQPAGVAGGGARGAVPRPEANPRLQLLLRYWDAQRAGRTMPARRDIDPVALAPILPSMLLLDVLPGPDFRYRVFGTGLTMLYGREMTGRPVSEIRDAALRDRVVAAYTTVVLTGAPLFSELTIDSAGRPRPHHRLLLPLTAGGDAVGMVIGAVVPAEGAPAAPGLRSGG